MAMPVVHQTDLFHPHGDPDDHFDLACVFALALRGAFDLRGVMIDYPPSHRKGDPDVMAVAQLNLATGLAVPAAIGSPVGMADREDARPDASRNELGAVRMLLDALRDASQPLAVVCVGSAVDIAVAAKREPGLFAEKCRGVYLNAGTGGVSQQSGEQLEFNVELNRSAYAAIFDLPCPVYWMPCWHETGERAVGAYGTFYWLDHARALGDLPPRLRNYFLYMFGQVHDPRWLRYLEGEPDETLWSEVLPARRGMWSTASIFHAAGLHVKRDGSVAPLSDDADPLYTLDPVRVTCTDDGVTQWEPDPGADSRFLFHVRDTERYEPAMGEAVRSLFRTFAETGS